jgi:uncharacterized FAD-dependent dehydrogenase
MEFQSIEKAWHLAGETQKVPAQRMIDFHKSVVSSDIPKTSVPGTTQWKWDRFFLVLTDIKKVLLNLEVDAWVFD